MSIVHLLEAALAAAGLIIGLCWAVCYLALRSGHHPGTHDTFRDERPDPSRGTRRGADL